MADETRDVQIVKDGRSGTVQYPTAWTDKQVDDHLAENGARRFTQPSPGFGEASRVFNLGPLKVETGPSPFYTYVKNMTPTEKAIFVGTLPIGGVAAGAGKLARLGFGALQVAKGTAAGAVGAGLEQQIGEEGKAPSIKQGALQGFLTAMGGQLTQPILNSVSKMFMGHITQSFVDGQSLKNFLTKLAPELQAAGDKPADIFNAVMRGKIAVTAQQQVQAAVEAAAKTATSSHVALPEVTDLMRKTGMTLQYPNVDLQTGLMSVKDAMDIHAGLARFATRDGAEMAGKPAALVQNIRDHAEGLIDQALGDKAAGLWTAGKARYGALMRVNDFLTDKAGDVFKASGIPDFEALQQKFLKDFAGDHKVQKLMGQAYDDLMQTVFRQGSVLVRDVPGYIPKIREAVGFGHPRAYLGMPTPAKLSGSPGEIPAGSIDPLAALVAPSLMGGNIPSGVGP